MGNLWERRPDKRATIKAKKMRAKRLAVSHTSDEERLPDPVETAEGVFGTVVGIGRRMAEVSFDGRTVACALSGGANLTVGDRVALDTEDTENPRILHRIRRKNVIARLRGDWTRGGTQGFEEHALAANVDAAVIVVSATNPVFHPRFIDRCLIALEAGNVPPVICITKSDLVSKIDEAKALYAPLGIPIFEISTVTGAGMDALKDALRSKTVVLFGQSGVGKSSLLRILMPDADIRTQDVREKTGTGKHTTTGSRMYVWAPESFIIDTPGIRSLGVDDIPREELRTFFHEFDAAAQGCRYRDCLHDKEDGCAVRKAVADGTVNRARYEGYLRLLGER